MTATIQKILKPTKYRAVDTSTSYQPVSQNYVINPAFDSNINNWISTQGASHDTGDNSLKITIESSGAFVYSAPQASGWVAGSHPFVAGKRYRVKFKAKGSATNQIRIQDNTSNTGGLLASNTVTTLTTSYVDYEFEWTANSNSNTVLFGRNSASETSWNFNIDDVQVYLLESFSNNNHGQIYSGRALEFDGVSDYLRPTTTNGDTAGGVGMLTTSGNSSAQDNRTVAFWMKPAETGTFAAHQQIFYSSAGGGNEGYGILLKTTGLITMEVDDGTTRHQQTGSFDFRTSGQTWHRVICVFDGVNCNMTMYVNGIETLNTNTSQWTGDISPSHVTTIGGHSTAATYPFDGMMADFQVWNELWTQSDVTYDYLNPESLALSNGGTSLTESNLKLWYPMQDGHRGQQSYIMDGANTGLGSEEIVTGWNNNDFTSLSSTGTNITSAVSNGSANHELYSNAINMTSGDAFKVTFTLGGTTGSALRFYLSTNAHLGSADYVTDTLSTGTYTFYINSNTTDSTMYFGFRSTYQVCDFSVSNFSVKRVNYKHHATTVFTGDELFTTSDASSITNEANGTGAWTATDASTTTISVESTTVHHGSYATKYQATGNGGGVYIDMDNYCTAGRRYTISIYARHAGDGDASNGHKVRFSSATNLSSGIISVGDELNKESHAAAWHERSLTFVYNSTTHRYFGAKESGSEDNGSILLDSLSIKEVGVASGWTDADQQIDIPQTALQSYNQLAWFAGGGSAQGATLDSTISTTTTDWSMSFWIFKQENYENFDFFMGSSTTANFVFDNNANRKLYYRDSGGSYHSLSDNEIPDNEWVHIVITVDGNTSMTAYVNGEVQDTDSGMTGTAFVLDRFMNGYASDQYETRGCITEIAYFANRKLGQVNVNQLYNDGKAYDARNINDASYLAHYWRNDGLAEWKDLVGSNDINCNAVETVLFPAGVESSRCTQGFYINRQKDTNSLNLADGLNTINSPDDITYVGIIDNPLNLSNDFSVSLWVKPHRLYASGIQSCIQLNDDDSNHFSVGISGNTPKIGVALETTAGGKSRSVSLFNDSNNIGEGKWTHIVVCGSSGVSTGNNSATLVDSAANFIVDELIGGRIWDSTDEQGATITDNTLTEVTGALSGSDDWDTNDKYVITKVYVNGSVNTQTITDNTGMPDGTDLNNTYWIGSDNTAQRQVNGQVDDVLCYQKWLTEKEVNRIYKAGKRSHK